MLGLSKLNNHWSSKQHHHRNLFTGVLSVRLRGAAGVRLRQRSVTRGEATSIVLNA